jgi:hypothetical protein
MAEIDFPDSPTVGQVFGKWTWNGVGWELTTIPGGYGTVVFASTIVHPNVVHSSSGIHDAATFGSASTFPFPTTMFAWSVHYFGNGVGGINAHSRLLRHSTGTLLAVPPGVTQSATGQYAVHTLMYGLAYAAGEDTRFRTQINITAMGSGTCTSSVHTTVIGYRSG